MYLGQGRAWALPAPPKCNLFLVGVGTTLCLGIIVQTWFQIISTFNVYIKMGFFCPLRRAKRKLGGRGGGCKGENGSQIKTKKVSRQTLNDTLESLLGK